MKEKKEYLISVGFKPMSEDENNVLFVNNGYVISVANPDQTLEDVVAEAEYSLKNEDIIEREELPFDGEEEDPFISNSEAVEPQFICEELDAIPTPVFRRLSLDGNRYYYRLLEDGSVKIYASGTNLINDGYADNKDTLMQWKELQKLMGQNPKDVTEYAADKGTIMHFLYEQYLKGRDMYLRRSFIIKLLEESDLRISKKNMDRFKSSVEDLDDMIERLVRFAKFCTDYELRPMAIEKILSCEQYDVASPIDLIAEIYEEKTVEGYFGEVYQKNTKDKKKGDPKLSTKKIKEKKIVIIDFKSGGMHNSQILQLELYRRMVKEWYNIDVDGIYNFSPKSESSKKYTFRERSGSKEIKKADCVFMQGMINHQNKDKKFKTYKGCLNINNSFKEEDCTITYDIAEELAKRFKNE